MKVQKFRSTWISGFLSTYEFAIISDRKTITQRLPAFFIWFNVHIQRFSRIKMLLIDGRAGLYWSALFPFQIHKIFNHDILGLLDKSKIPGHCGFPLANPHSGESVDFVPKSNPSNILILLYICSANPQFIRWIKPSMNSHGVGINRCYFIKVSKWYLRYKI